MSQADDINDLSAFLIGEMAPFDRPFTAAALLASAEQITERQQSNDANYVNALLSLAYQYQNLTQDDKARRVLERAYKISRGFADPSTGAKAACALAAATAQTWTEGAGDRGEKYFKEAMDALPAEPQYALHRIYCYLRGSELANYAANIPLALERVHAAEEILESSGLSSPALELKIQMALAKAYNNGTTYRESSEAYAEAARRMAALGRDRTRTAGMVYNNWAAGLFFQGRPFEAEPLFGVRSRFSGTSRTKGATSCPPGSSTTTRARSPNCTACRKRRVPPKRPSRAARARRIRGCSRACC